MIQSRLLKVFFVVVLQQLSCFAMECDVRVVTGKLRYAGTDGHVYIKIDGTKGSSAVHELKGDGTKDLFEWGQTDDFKIDVKQDIGEPTKLYVKLIKRRVHWEGWNLASVAIKPVSSDRYYRFINPHRWINYYNKWYTIDVTCEDDEIKNPNTGACEPVSSSGALF